MKLQLKKLRAIIREALNETRDETSPRLVLAAWEKLYQESGPPSIDDVASWLGTTTGAVMYALPRDLRVDIDGTVRHESDAVDHYSDGEPLEGGWNER